MKVSTGQDDRTHPQNTRVTLKYGYFSICPVLCQRMGGFKPHVLNNIDSSPLKRPGNQFPGKVVSVVMGLEILSLKAF